MIMSTKLTQSNEFRNLSFVIHQASNEADVTSLINEHGVANFDVVIMDEVR
jgi:hypothetical protein